MLAHHSLCSFLFLLLGATALAAQVSQKANTFSCTGGSIYFSAHPVDSLLFQNPDLLHDIYVFKCVTAVVFTSGDYGTAKVFSLLERGLDAAYSWMAGLPIKEAVPEAATLQVGKHNVSFWSLRGMPSIHILYLRLPDSPHHGQGHDAHGGESLKKLYYKEIDTITTVDRNATYTLDALKDLIATILHERQANDIRVLNHMAFLPEDEHDGNSEHADHIITAKIVTEVIEREKTTADVQAYASDFMRRLEANLNVSHPDFRKKVDAFFKYAAHDKHTCQTLKECEDRIEDGEADLLPDNDAKYVAQYLEREYYVS